MASEARRKRIRALFGSANELMNMRQFARYVLESDVYTEEDLHRIHFRAVMADCRKALSEDGPEGVPFAQPTGQEEDEDGKLLPIWKQLALFTEKESEALIHRRVLDLQFDHSKLQKLQEWHQERYGSAPEIPQLQVYSLQD